jgi:glycosyltransferase involved in cell wall biosynthesis
VKLPHSKQITILMLAWRDIRSADRGGAELFAHEMLSRLDRAKYRIVHIAPRQPDLPEIEAIDAITYLRMGNRLTVIGYALRFYRRNQHTIAYVIDHCNTHRFFTPLWVSKPKRLFLIHQLTREIWFAHLPFPLNVIGYMLETPMLRLARHDPTLTVSASTKAELVAIGFDPARVQILPEGLNFEPWSPSAFLPKAGKTFIYVGRYARYKGIEAIIRALAQVKETHRDIRLWLVGKINVDYYRAVLKPLMATHGLTVSIHIESDPTSGAASGADIVLWGYVPQAQKLELMSRAVAALFPSQREGWGLTVTEAAVVGTPSIVYPSPGLVDAVDHGRAGYITATCTAEALAAMMLTALADEGRYAQMRQRAYAFSRPLHWDHTARAFELFLDALRQQARTGKHSQ